MSSGEYRDTGHPEGVTEFVEMRTREIYHDGALVDGDTETIRRGKLSDTGMRDSLLGIGMMAGGKPRPPSTNQRQAGVVELQRFFRDVRIEAGPWADLSEPVAVRPAGVPRIAQKLILAGQLVCGRYTAAGDPVVTLLSGPAIPVWPLTAELADQGVQPIGVAQHTAEPGRAVGLSPLTGTPQPVASAEADPVQMREYPTPTADQRDSFAQRRHMGALLTWDDLNALTLAAEKVVSRLGDYPTPPDDRPEDLLRKLRSALGKLELGRVHGYEAAES